MGNRDQVVVVIRNDLARRLSEVARETSLSAEQIVCLLVRHYVDDVDRERAADATAPEGFMPSLM